jgi:hypothetical protein
MLSDVAGAAKITFTSRLPHRGHRRLAKWEVETFGQTGVCMSSSAIH